MSKNTIQCITRLVIVAELVGDLEQLARHSPEKIKHLAADLDAHGLLQAILTMGGKRIIAGHGRYLAAKALGWKEIEAKDYPAGLTETQVEVLRAVENLQRSDLTGYQKWQLCLRLMQLNPEWKAKDLAEHLHLDPGMITRLLSPSNCIPANQDAFKAGLLSLEDCYTCSRLDAAAQHEFLAAKTSKGNVSDVVRRARRARNGNGDAKRVSRVNIPLPSGWNVAVAGAAIGMSELVDALADALKEARRYADQYDVKTFQSMMRDKSKGHGD